jgi:hypothetical protein
MRKGEIWLFWGPFLDFLQLIGVLYTIRRRRTLTLYIYDLYCWKQYFYAKNLFLVKMHRILVVLVLTIFFLKPNNIFLTITFV